MAIQKSSAPYTGSPLGLITSLSEFEYKSDKGYESIFTSYQSKGQKHILKSYAGYNKTAVLSGTPHSNEVYDVSTSNIIDKLKSLDHLKLNFADFAYLKNFGVYPNNRMVVARRFPTPVVDDLYSTKPGIVGNPLSTVIGYIGEDEDFLKLSFSESWRDAEVSFVNVLNSLGKDFGFNLGGGLGSILEGAVNAVPLPGATLLLQRKIMESIGIINPGEAAVIPQGDPNLIKEARARTLIGENDPGSGLECKINLQIKTVYEQKFINGVDPTVVFMDILNNTLNMGTSVATFYLGKQVDASKSVSAYLEKFMKDPGQEIKKFIESIISAFKESLKKLDEAMKKAKVSDEDRKNKEDGSGGTQILEDISKLINTFTSAVGSVRDYVSDFIRAKYKIKFIGIINALTGGPSTPWHVTIGNPLRPIFCSGDMLCKGVDVNFGPQLSFNDLPTFIEVTVNLESARNLGLQEIFGKFNTGGIRTVSGTHSGEYLAGIADSFWTFTGVTSSQFSKTSLSTQFTDNTEKTDNSIFATQSNLTKVVSITSTSSITPSNLSLEINCDPLNPDPVSPAGLNFVSDKIRIDNMQTTIGSVEGSVDQKISPVNIENTGVNSKIINNISEKPLKGSYKYETIRNISGSGNYVNLTVKDDTNKIVFTDSKIYNLSDDINEIESQLRIKAKTILNDY